MTSLNVESGRTPIRCCNYEHPVDDVDAINVFVFVGWSRPSAFLERSLPANLLPKSIRSDHGRVLIITNNQTITHPFDGTATLSPLSPPDFIPEDLICGTLPPASTAEWLSRKKASKRGGRSKYVGAKHHARDALSSTECSMERLILLLVRLRTIICFHLVPFDTTGIFIAGSNHNGQVVHGTKFPTPVMPNVPTKIGFNQRFNIDITLTYFLLV
ncbi:hypothetical protein CPC08DRAFT_770933 [Agrocybe pediades]|nr:hypothetical protein CPC08DRAFT_770933 [Agrocybe pediades]